MSNGDGDPRKPQILIGIDDSPPTQAAVSHVLDVFSACECKPHVTLLTVIEHARPAGFDCGEPALTMDSATMPAVPQAGLAGLALEQRRRVAQQILDGYARQFAAGGWPGDRVVTEVVDGVFTHSAIAEVIAREAQDRQMDIVVVGRTPHGRLFQALLRSTGERLLLRLNTVTVWVVGSPGDQAERSGGSPSTVLPDSKTG